MDLSLLNLSPGDLEALLKSLQCNADVVRLDLSNNLIDDQGVINVCQMVASLPRLKCLNLASNLLTVDGIMKMDNQFSVVRGQLAELSELSLSFNKITDEGVRNVSRMCGNLPNLSKLHLKSCHLTSLEHFNVGLDQVVSLDVSHNSFRNLRALWRNLRVDRVRSLNFDLAIADSYSSFPGELIEFFKISNMRPLQLESLSLANCNLTDIVVWELVQALKSGVNLKKLNFMSNPNLSSLSLKSVLKSNWPLEEMNFCGCPQVMSELKASDLFECTSEATALPRKIILPVPSAEDKDSITTAFKDIWMSHFGSDKVNVGVSSSTIVVMSV